MKLQKVTRQMPVKRLLATVIVISSFSLLGWGSVLFVRYLQTLNPRELGNHSSPIMDCRLLPGTNRVATMSYTHICICDSNGKNPLFLAGHRAPITAIDRTPDGKTLISSSLDGTIKFWDIDNGTESSKLEIEKGGEVLNTVLDSSGKLMATLSSLKNVWYVTVWDLETRKNLRRSKVGNNQLHRVSFDATGNQLAFGSATGDVYCWNWKYEEGPQIIVGGEARKGPIFATAFRPGRSELAIGGKQRVIKIIDLVTKAKVKELYGHWGEINRLHFSPDGTTLISASSDFSVGIWDLAAGSLSAQHRHHPSQVMALDCDFLTDRMLTGGYGPSTKLWRGFLSRYRYGSINR
ncbi:WD domain, G-beta repeat [Pirellula sp. SH-Sr6A]|uniref:WD40 repeat domain-containing protein n=1 Tax=Pirellula sp. SH-Sr6A TaxID=1632865 RepID=UPI00078EB0FD|nr:hypothetical protein [Pirellula sp. SH-Sr6A]AMV35662.1 WD domain, G-beta repeat [Pirellula sp. SH-Sr6A]